MPQAPTFVTLAGPPDTLVGMYDNVDFVVLGTVTSSDDPVPFSPKSSTVVRYHTVTVREILKANAKVPVSQMVRVLQIGGTIELNGEERTTAFPFPLLLKNEDVVLFLMREPGKDFFNIAFSGGAITVDGRDRAARVPDVLRQRVKDFSGRTRMPSEELLSNLRRLRDGRGHSLN